MKQHSPVILGLLLAATLAVDAVAISWLTRDTVASRASVLYDALVSGQLAVVCLWAVFRARTALFGWLAVIAAVIVTAIPAMQLGILTFGEACGIYGGYTATLAVALWILRRTTFWQRLTQLSPTVWQFSLTQLLAAMTLVAVLIVSLRNSQFAGPANDFWRFVTLLTIGDVLVVLGTLLAWAMIAHWLPRLAGTCAVAATLGVIEAMCVDAGLMGEQIALSLDRNVVDFVAYTTIMALMIFAWLELTPLVPHARRAASLPPAEEDAT